MYALDTKEQTPENVCQIIYIPLCGEGIKQNQNKPMETTRKLFQNTFSSNLAPLNFTDSNSHPVQIFLMDNILEVFVY